MSHRHTVVVFIRCNIEIALKCAPTHDAYFLVTGTRGKRISYELAQHIISTYRVGQYQPNSRYS